MKIRIEHAIWQSACIPQAKKKTHKIEHTTRTLRIALGLTISSLLLMTYYLLFDEVAHCKHTDICEVFASPWDIPQRPFNKIKTASLYSRKCYQIEGWPRPNAQVVRAEVLCLPVLYVRIYRAIQYWKAITSALTTCALGLIFQFSTTWRTGFPRSGPRSTDHATAREKQTRLIVFTSKVSLDIPIFVFLRCALDYKCEDGRSSESGVA